MLDVAVAKWMVERGQSMVYWIELVEDRAAGVISVWRDREQHDAELRALRELVDQSGGRTLTISEPSLAPAVFEEILQELRDQYVLGYYPSVDRDDGKWHTVKVRVRPRDLQVRARSGYWDLP